MTARMVHIKDGVTFTMHEPDFVDTSTAVPGQKQRLTLRAASIKTVSHFVASQDRKAKRRYGPVRFIERAWDQCAWIYPSGLCCGLRTVPDASWCSEHDDIVHGRARKMEAAE